MSNTNSFQALQLQLANRIRTGKGELDNIESRRVTIYKELFFNNIESFCSTAFPVTQSLLGTETWGRLVRRFFVEHQCETPHFIEISQEFLSYLIEKQSEYPDFPYLAELAHYEWIELDLSVKPNVYKTNTENDGVNKLDGFILSPECYPLLYNYPVHVISLDNYDTIEPQLTGLVVYRNVEFNVKFILVDQLTVILLQLIQQNAGITKQSLINELIGLNESFTEAQMDAFLANALPRFLQLKLVKPA